MLKVNEKIICCILAIIMFLTGMCLDNIEIGSSFLCQNLTRQDTTLRSVDYILDDIGSCTLDMLNKGTISIRGTVSNSVNKWKDKSVLYALVVRTDLQELFYYQSSECKEDAQLLLCRSVAVNYIHRKDGEK